MKISPYNIDAIKKYGYEGVLKIENEKKGVVPFLAPPQVEEEAVISIDPENFEHVVADHGGSTDSPEDSLHSPVIENEPELSMVVSAPESEPVSDEFDGMTLPELKELAKSLGIQKYWLKREDTLREEILEVRKS